MKSMNYAFLNKIVDSDYTRICNQLYDTCCNAEGFVFEDPKISLNCSRTANELIIKLFYFKKIGDYSKKSVKQMLCKKEFLIELSECLKNDKTAKWIHEKMFKVHNAGNPAHHGDKISDPLTSALITLSSLFKVVTAVITALNLYDDIPQYNEPSLQDYLHSKGESVSTTVRKLDSRQLTKDATVEVVKKQALEKKQFNQNVAPFSSSVVKTKTSTTKSADLMLDQTSSNPNTRKTKLFSSIQICMKKPVFFSIFGLFVTGLVYLIPEAEWIKASADASNAYETIGGIFVLVAMPMLCIMDAYSEKVKMNLIEMICFLIMILISISILKVMLPFLISQELPLMINQKDLCLRLGGSYGLSVLIFLSIRIRIANKYNKKGTKTELRTQS